MVDASVLGLRASAAEFDLLSFSENSGWLAEAAKVIAAAADRIEELETAGTTLVEGQENATA